MTWRFVLGGLLIILGVGFLMDINVFRYIVPLFFIWLGWTILSGRNGSGKVEKTSQVHTDTIKDVFIFSGADRVVESEKFRGGKIVCVFGGANVDLRKVKADGSEVRMEFVAVFGGMRVRIPETWKVKSEGVAIMGGYDVHTVNTIKKPVLFVIKGAAVLGGVEIIN